MRNRCSAGERSRRAAGGLLVLALVAGLAGCKGKEDEPEVYAAVGARTSAGQADAGRTGAARGVAAAPAGVPAPPLTAAGDTQGQRGGGDEAVGSESAVPGPTPEEPSSSVGESPTGASTGQSARAPSEPRASPTTAKGPKPTPKPEGDDGSAMAIRGTVETVSHVPEPGTAPYTECVTFIKFRVDAVIVGQYDERELLAVFWGMKDNRLEPAARYREGQQFELKLVPFETMKDLSQVMQADDTEDYSSTPYWVLSGEEV